MKIAILNDTHAGARSESLIFNEYFFQFFEDIFFPHLKANGIEFVLHLGDLVDRRKFINFVIANSWRTRFFDRIRDEKIQFQALVGNHDIPYRNTNEVNAAQELLHMYDNTSVVTEPTDTSFDGLPVLLLPWITSENYHMTLDKIRNTKAKIVFGHLEISGFEMDKNNVCHTGLDRKMFNKFDQVISGHFHHKSSDGCINYLGAQYEMTWVDYDDIKGFHVFDTDTKKLEFIRNPYIMFHKIWYDDTVNDINYWSKQDFSKYKSRYVKVIVTNKSNPFVFDKVIDMIYQHNPADISIVEDYGTIFDDSSTIVSQSEDTVTLMNRYIDGATLEDRIEKEPLKAIMRELYIEAVDIQ